MSAAAVLDPNIPMAPAFYPRPGSTEPYAPALQVPQGTLLEAGAPREAAAVQLQPGMLPPPGGAVSTEWAQHESQRLRGSSTAAQAAPAKAKAPAPPVPRSAQEEEADLAEALRRSTEESGIATQRERADVQEAIAHSLGQPVEARDTGNASASGSGGAGREQRPVPMDISEPTQRFLEPEEAEPAAPAAEAAAPAVEPPADPVVEVVEPRTMLGGMPAPFHPAFGIVSPDPNVPLSAEYIARLQAIAQWWSQPAPDRARQMATGDLPFRAVGPDQSVLSVFHIGNLIAQLHHIAPVLPTTDVGRAFPNSHRFAQRARRASPPPAPPIARNRVAARH